MTFVLDHIGLSVGEEVMIDDVSLTLQRVSGRRAVDDAEIRAAGEDQRRLAIPARTAKTVTLKKSLVSFRLIRESDIWADAITELAPRVGGLVEFYRSPARKLLTPTGVNVPDYRRMARVWWHNMSKAIADGNTAARRKFANEKPRGVTIDPDEPLKTWKAQMPAPKKG